MISLGFKTFPLVKWQKKNVNFFYSHLDKNLYWLSEVGANNPNLSKVSSYMWVLQCVKTLI